MDLTLEQALPNHVVTVKFRKVGGDIREMKCTLQESFLPVRAESTRTKKKNDAVQSVFDLEKNAWRGFRKDSVIDWKIND